MRRSGFVLATVLIASCLGRPGPPVVAPTRTLSIDRALSGPRTRAEFAVVFAAPRGVVEDLAEPGVTVLFNREMRSLDEDDDTAHVPPLAVRTQQGAPVAGQWRWVGTHGLLFVPRGDLAGGTRFEVTVPRGTASLEGEALAADYSFTFTTQRPRLLDSVPAEGSDALRPDEAIRVAFNQAVDPAELERSARLLVRTGDAPNDAPVPISVDRLAAPASPPPAPASGAAATRRLHPERVLLVTPRRPLPLDAAVELVIAPGLRGEGPLATKDPVHLHLRTYGPLRLARVTCPRVFDSTLGECQAHRDITVSLTNPVMPDEFRRHVALGRLPRAPRATPEATARKPTPRPTLAFALGADPGFDERYRVTLKAGMTDVYGQRLARDIAFDVDTEPPFSHAASGARPASGGDSSGDSADSRPPPNVPSRAIPPFVVGFGIDGYVLEAGARRHVVPVGLVNVPTFGVVGRALDARETRQWLAGLATSPGGFLSGGYRFSWETPDPAANTRIVRTVDLDALLAPGGRGTALLALGTPAQATPIREQLVSVTDLAVTAKMSKFGSLVWVTRLSTGKPVAGAQVSVGLLKRGDEKTFVTDDRGIALVPADAFAPVRETRRGWGGDAAAPDDQAIVVVRAGDDWTYERVEESPSFERAAPEVDLGAAREWQGTVFADRGVYRPGETVKLAAVLRQADARGLSIAAGRDVRVQIADAQGGTIFDSRAKLDDLGGLALDAPLPRTAHLGQATATLSLESSRATFSTGLLIADFKPTEFVVTAKADRAEMVRGDRAHFQVHGQYLFQAPMANAAAHDTAVRSVTSFSPKGSDGYVTSDEAFTEAYGDRSPRAGEMLEQDAQLDAAGDHDAWVDLAMPGQTRPEIVSFESDVEDFTRQVVAGTASVLVHPAEFYVGVQRPKSRFVAVGATLRPGVLALRPDGAHVPGARVKLELVERTWTTVVEDTGDGSRKSTVHDETVGACDVVTGAAPVSCAMRVPKAGYFIVRATASDARGNVVRASTAVYALSDRPDEAKPIGWAEGDARVVKLESDEASYQPGEAAKILVRNPFPVAEALVTVERGGVLASETTELRGPMPVVSIPIADDYFPNVFVSVHLVRGRIGAAPAPAGGADVSGPDYRDGYVTLPVSPETHRLHVEVKADRKEHHPGDPVDADVLVTDAQGKAVRAEVTFYAVDEGVLALTGYKTPDPLAAFTQPRSLAVFGMESRDHLARILALKAGEKLRDVGWETSGQDKGGDGGGGGETGERIRRDFRNTAFFEAGLVTSDEGRVHVHFTLPDNLTTFRLMAVAAATDRFGSGQTSVTSSKRLMARPALPRAIRVGDRLDASVVVSGRELGAAAVDVRIALRGAHGAADAHGSSEAPAGGSPALALVGPATRRVMLPASGNVEVHFPLVARSPGDETIAFSVRGGGASDTVEAHKTVELPLHLESTAVYGETTGAAAIALGDLSKIRSDQGALEVRLASTALVGLDGAFDALDDYPYGCTEQLSSRMIPLLSLDDLARWAGVRVPAASDDRMQDAVAKLLAHQHDSGGFGYWDDDREVPWLSAYAMLALDAAARKGFYVPHEALDRGVEYLRQALAAQKHIGGDDGSQQGVAGTSDGTSSGGTASGSSGDDDSSPSSTGSPDDDDTGAAAYAQAAFLADALASLGKPDPGYLNGLYDARAGQPLFTQALLLHAMAKAAMPASETTTLAGEVGARLRVDADSAVAQDEDTPVAPLLDSTTRTTALVLRALLAVDPHHPLAPRLAKGLLLERTSGAWGSTQEDAWSLVALDAYRKAQEAAHPSFDVDVFLGSARVGGATFHDAAIHDQRITLLPSQVKQLGGPLTFATTGAGKLFYSAELRYEVADLPSRPLDRGLFVEKIMHAVPVADLAQATQWIPRKTSLTAHAGELVVVDVLLESAEPREQVVIDDPLPAGLEGVDFDLATTGSLHHVDDAVRTDRPPPPDALADLGTPFRSTPQHREIRDDRVLTFLSHLAPGMYHFRYLARATAVGTFVVPPTSATCMYSPDVFGRTRAATYEVVR